MDAIKTTDWQEYMNSRKGKHKNTATTLQGILDFIVNYAIDNGYMPHKKEIAEALNIDIATCYAHLKEARGLGLLEWVDRQERTFTMRGVYYVDDRI